MDLSEDSNILVLEDCLKEIPEEYQRIVLQQAGVFLGVGYQNGISSGIQMQRDGQNCKPAGNNLANQKQTAMQEYLMRRRNELDKA